MWFYANCGNLQSMMQHSVDKSHGYNFHSFAVALYSDFDVIIKILRSSQILFHCWMLDTVVSITASIIGADFASRSGIYCIHFFALLCFSLMSESHLSRWRKYRCSNSKKLKLSKNTFERCQRNNPKEARNRNAEPVTAALIIVAVTVLKTLGVVSLDNEDAVIIRDKKAEVDIQKKWHLWTKYRQNWAHTK